MKRLLACLFASWLLLGMGISVAEDLDLSSDQGIKELRKKIFGGVDVSVSGIGRIEGTLEHRFRELTDIGGPASSNAADESFYDFRSYLTTKIKKDQFSMVLSVDIAGDDFTDPEGAVFGNGLDSRSSPGGPAVVRDSGWDLRTRHLYLNYDGFVKASAGRLPLKLAHGIVVSTIRDSAKVVKPFKAFAVGGVVVKGGETIPNANLKIDPEGINDNDLEAFVLFGKYKQKFLATQLTYAFQKDSRLDKGFPQKKYIDLSVDGVAGRLTYQLEGAWFGGKTPFNAAKGQRLKNDAWMGYAKVKYSFSDMHSGIGVAAGYGSGDNDPGDTDQSDFQSLFMNAIGFHIANIYGNDIHSYDAYIPGTPGSDGNNSGSGFANTTFFQLTAFHQPVEKLTFKGIFSYFVATESQFVGEGVLLHPNDGTAAPGETKRSNDIGWEADLDFDYQISDSFSFYTHLGYFSAGDIWGRSAPNATKLQGGLLFKF